MNCHVFLVIFSYFFRDRHTRDCEVDIEINMCSMSGGGAGGFSTLFKKCNFILLHALNL